VSELVVPVVVLLLVLGAIAAGVVYALRQRRRADPTAPAPDRPAPAAPVEKRSAPPPESSRRRSAPAPPVAVRPLPAEARQRYLAAWQGVQTRAADRPVLALSEADAIVARLLVDRGLPTTEPRTAADRRALEQLPQAERSALDSYRSGHALEQANSSTRSDPDQVREGMAHLHRAFRALVEDGDTTPYGDGPGGPPPSPADERPRTGSG
jgi:hypothetical protein